MVNFWEHQNAGLKESKEEAKSQLFDPKEIERLIAQKQALRRDPETGMPRPKAVPNRLDTAEEIAKTFHYTYEALAPLFRWETQTASRTSWEDLPDKNKNLMIATVASLLASGVIK